MLRLENIIKNYESGGQSFPALKGVSLAFRKSEFVSILGPSGCGKTTLLNIIGGLDHYTSGDLVIEGKSTKQYTSHDWDVYRNYRIGFIFQSYNLIPHQNIVENVELALTIAGYSKDEKRKKAMKALDMVGLKNAYKKMPNQLSGGQCQRVAIARALVNEPDILLGDEPTGALDSKTSVQIMKLIKRISKKKLVIMVTHNPPLAKEYSTRIISLLDGNVVGDTDPYKLAEEAKEKRSEFKGIKTSGKSNALVKPSKAKMSFWDAFKLSAKNLISKRKRTIMVIAASSIGIVGVSAVLAVSSGVKDYIKGVQNDMLSGNPLRASEKSLDIASVLSNLSNLTKGHAVSESIKDGYIDIEYLTQALIKNAKSGSIIKNDITPDYVSYIKAMPKEYRAEIHEDYGLSFANNIYTITDVEELDGSKFSKGQTAYSLSGLKNVYTALLANLSTEELNLVGLSNIAANFPNVFYQGLDNNEYISSQYDVLFGSLPKENADNECVVVLNKRKKLMDLIVTLSGMMSEKDFVKSIWKFLDGKDLTKEDLQKIDYKDILNRKFYYVPNNGEEKYSEGAFYLNDFDPEKPTEFATRPFGYNMRFKTDLNKQTGEITKFTSYRDDGKEGTNISVGSDKGQVKEIKVVGIISPKEGKNYGSLSSGVYFRSPLAKKIQSDMCNSDLYNFVTKIKTAEPLSSAPYYQNYIFLPAKMEQWAEETEGFINVGLTYKLGFKMVDRSGAVLKDSDVKTYGTVGDGAFINPRAESKGKPGISITSSLDTRQIAGYKTIETPKKGDPTKVDYSYSYVPQDIEIFTKDFETKDKAKAYMESWNDKTKTITFKDPDTGEEKSLSPDERIFVQPTDNLQLIVAMINNLITTTTVSLTIFASLSLVVSTVMISIITYISVMERIKEIGVIRSLGGRKKDVSHLFNAETFILGGISGLFGIAVTYIFELVLDIAIYKVYKIPMIANLRWWTALIMIALSIVLTAIAGLIPARSAAKKDPVTALRSE